MLCEPFTSSESDTCKINSSGSSEDCKVASLEDHQRERERERTNKISIFPPQIVKNRQGSPDIILDGGIMFPDIISINFSVSVTEIEDGKGEVHSMVVGYLLCKHSYFQKWPENIEQCGPFSGVKEGFSSLIGRGPTRLGSHWSRASECCLRQQSFAIRNQLVASKDPY